MNSPFKSITPGFINGSENKSVDGIDPESEAEGSKVIIGNN